jgi:transmembrane sensor
MADIDWQIIDRHLAGTASPDDEAAVRRWLASDAANAILLERLAADVRAPLGVDVGAAWARLEPRLDEPRRPTRPVLARVAAPARRRMRAPVWIAAGLAAAIVFAVVRPDVEQTKQRTATTAVTPVMRVVTAPNSRQSSVMLSDGTRVRLNAGSTLRHGADYGRTSRDVQLEGEAYFDVVHDASRPFRVHARGAVAEDLGTRFVVRAYAELARLEVAVEEGRVALRADRPASDSALLLPGQLGRFAPDGALSVESGVDLERWLGWTHGALVLDGMPLAQAARTIGRRFDVDVAVRGDRLSARTLSARFRDESLEQVLDALAVALDARWTRDGRSITIAPAE